MLTFGASIDDILSIFFYLLILIFSVSFHEYSHGKVSFTFGDDTAKNQGRLTLNPIKHLDPLGSVLLPLFMLAFNVGFIFGWAKPVPINPNNYQDKRKGWILTSLAGPSANFLLSFIFFILIVAFMNIFLSLSFLSINYHIVVSLLVYGFILNIILGIFNLIPVYPLDGFWVLFNILPKILQGKIERFLSDVYLLKKHYIVWIINILMVIIAILIARIIIPPVVSFVAKYLSLISMYFF